MIELLTQESIILESRRVRQLDKKYVFFLFKLSLLPVHRTQAVSRNDRLWNCSCRTLDAGNALAQLTGDQAMTLAIDKATQFAAGYVRPRRIEKRPVDHRSQKLIQG